MDLKQGITIMNEYTIKNGSGGSRGGSPGQYILRYMARNGATEPTPPILLHDDDDYIDKYDARREASDTAESIPKMKKSMRDAQKRGGVAFGYGSISLSEDKLKAASRDIQDNFEQGKTVFKTVISFDTQYLEECGILEPGFVFQKPGDFRGHIDQMKLRMAIMNGMERLGRFYDDFQYIGSIQVDAAHVHCHIAAVDRGKGNLMPDGTQRGKFSKPQLLTIRRGIDMYLDENQTIRMLSSSVMYDKRNVLLHVKKYAHRAIEQQGFTQFLVACLPENKNYWRAGTNRKEMVKANALVREFVTDLLRDPTSGYQDTLKGIQRYADYRKEHERLDDMEYNKIIRDGQNQIIEDCMNGVYAVLKQIPDSELTVQTPMLDIMSQNYDDLAAQAVSDPAIEFGFKLRSYSSRLQHHREEYHKYRDLHESYEKAPNKSEDAVPLGVFFAQEAEYNRMLMTKYQYFLSFLPPDEDIEDKFDKIMERKERLRKLQMMLHDPSLKKMKPENAEEYGIRLYGQYGGRRVKDQPGVIQGRIDKLAAQIANEERAFRDLLHDSGFDYDGHGVLKYRAYPFDEVKALDLHHMTYDFPYDIPISKVNLDIFCERARERHAAYEAARDYLIRSGQEAEVDTLSGADVQAMKEYADRFSTVSVIPASRPATGQFKRSRTISLDNDYMEQMRSVVETTVRNIQLVD